MSNINQMKIAGKENFDNNYHIVNKYDENKIKKILENNDKNSNKIIIVDKNDKQINKRMDKTLELIDHFDKFFKLIEIDGRKERKRIIQDKITTENFFTKKDKKRNVNLNIDINSNNNTNYSMNLFQKNEEEKNDIDKVYYIKNINLKNYKKLFNIPDTRNSIEENINYIESLPDRSNTIDTHDYEKDLVRKLISEKGKFNNNNIAYGNDDSAIMAKLMLKIDKKVNKPKIDFIKKNAERISIKINQINQIQSKDNQSQFKDFQKKSTLISNSNDSFKKFSSVSLGKNYINKNSMITPMKLNKSSFLRNEGINESYNSNNLNNLISTKFSSNVLKTNENKSSNDNYETSKFILPTLKTLPSIYSKSENNSSKNKDKDKNANKNKKERDTLNYINGLMIIEENEKFENENKEFDKKKFLDFKIKDIKINNFDFKNDKKSNYSIAINSNYDYYTKNNEKNRACVNEREKEIWDFDANNIN